MNRLLKITLWIIGSLTALVALLLLSVWISSGNKETSLLMNTALERYKLLLKTYPRIEQHMSQYHIASYLGIKPESLSQLKSFNIGQ